MENSLDGSVASLMRKFRIAAQNAPYKHEALRYSLNASQNQVLLSESEHSLISPQAPANDTDNLSQMQVGRIERLESQVYRLSADNTALKQELQQLYQDYRAFYRTAARASENTDSLAVKQLITQLFADYRRKMDDDVKQLQYLSKLAVHDRGLGVKCNDVLDLICKRLAVVENQVSTFESFVEERTAELQSYIQQLCDIYADNDRRSSKIEDALAILRRECGMKLAKYAIVGKRVCFALQKATMRIICDYLRSIDYKEQLLTTDVYQFAKDLIALREETELFKRKIGTALEACDCYSTIFANFKEQTNSRLIALDSGVSRLSQQFQECSRCKHAQTIEVEDSKLRSNETSFYTGYYAARLVAQQMLERPAENSDSSTGYQAPPLENKQQTFGKAEVKAGKHRIANQEKSNEDFFPYCLDTGRKVSQRLQAFDIGGINKLLKSDAPPVPTSNLRRVIQELQEVGDDTQERQRAQAYPTVEDILTRIDKLERRTMQRYIADMYD